MAFINSVLRAGGITPELAVVRDKPIFNVVAAEEKGRRKEWEEELDIYSYMGIY